MPKQTRYALECRDLDRAALIVDAQRRILEVLEDAALVNDAQDQRPDVWGFALMPGDYEQCQACNAVGGQLEMGGEPGTCQHLREDRMTRPCWLVVTSGGAVLPLTAALIAALQPTERERGVRVHAGGVISACLDVAIGQAEGEPLFNLDETLVIAPSHRTLRYASSCRTTILNPLHVSYPPTYTSPIKPSQWPA